MKPFQRTPPAPPPAAPVQPAKAEPPPPPPPAAPPAFVVPPPPWITVTADRVDFSNARISFQGNEMIDDPAHPTPAGLPVPQVRYLDVAHAYVAEGVMVIEDCGIALPLSSIKNIRKQTAAKEPTT